jgi:hypothetical protein
MPRVVAVKEDHGESALTHQWIGNADIVAWKKLGNTRLNLGLRP